ncbi:MAG: cupin domain-containing protein [Synergistaceae bacterium]|jgi:mannose-6-phosphate isomerase-like protein (cupin superfamily)|nr:cupin domain-containing protein [Synergistaceae bacterium]
MRLIKANEGTVYQAPNHFNFWGIRKFGPPEGSAGINISISEFLPDGGATMTASPDKERVYIVLRGTMTLKDEASNTYDLEEGDMIYIGPGEKRDITVTGKIACRTMVVMGPAAPK